MTNTDKKPLILLIQPPHAIPNDPSEQLRAIRSFLASHPIALQIDDAAMDFYQQVLIRGGPSRTQIDLTGHADQLRTSTHRWGVEALLQLTKMENQALETASKAFSPCEFHRSGVSIAGLDRLEDLLAFAHNAASNPFRHYADRIWQPVDGRVHPDLALIYLEKPGEMISAATLATMWHERWPQVPLRLICPKSLVDGASRPAQTPDHWPLKAITDMGQLQKTLSRTIAIDGGVSPSKDHGNGRFRVNNGIALVPQAIPAAVEAALKQNVPLVVWRDCGEDTADVTSQLYAASRQGVWNHLILDGESRDDIRQFAAANANIVHSYCYAEKPLSEFSDQIYTFPTSTPAYGRTRAMPGKPLWMELKDPDRIAKLLRHDNPKTLMRLRVREGGGAPFEVGKQLNYHFKPPGELPDGHLDEIVRMVAAGGSVNTQFVKHNLERAYLIAYVEEEGVIIGNSSLKQPRDEYIDAVSQQSGIDLHYYLERGYTSVRPEYRGLGVGVKLLEGLTQRAGDHKIFSVIAENNVATQKMAMRNRTRRVATFFSQRAKKEMSVWIPEWMLPEGIDLPPQPDLDIDRNSKKDGT